MNTTLNELLEAARSGTVLRVLALGDSMTSGTSSYAGWRDHFKSIMAEYGIAIEFVGSLTSQNGNLSSWSARDYAHEGNSGYTIGQIEGVVTPTYMTTYRPDIIIVAPLGHNNVGVTNEADTRAATESLIKTIRTSASYTPHIPIIIGTLTVRNSSGSIQMDSNLANVNNGVRQACDGQDNVACVDLHAELARSWNAVWHIAADSTHYNDIGYYRTALCLAKHLLQELRQPPVLAPVGVVTATSVSADVDYPQGAYISSTGGTVKVTTWDGRDVTLVFGGAAGTSGSFPATSTSALNMTPFPIVRIWNTGTSLGSHTLNAYPCKVGGLR